MMIRAGRALLTLLVVIGTIFFVGWNAPTISDVQHTVATHAKEIDKEAAVAQEGENVPLERDLGSSGNEKTEASEVKIKSSTNKKEKKKKKKKKTPSNEAQTNATKVKPSQQEGKAANKGETPKSKEESRDLIKQLDDVTETKNPTKKAEQKQGAQREEVPLRVAENKEETSTTEENSSTKTEKVAYDSKKETQQNFPDYSSLLTVAGMQTQFAEARESFRERMKPVYGAYYWDMFEPAGVSVGHHYIHKSAGRLDYNLGNQTIPNRADGASVSWYRMVRKLKVKLLQVQLGILKHKLGESPPQEFYSQYIWVSGGDSSVAGFPGFVHQTYTYVLEESAREAFANVGIRFIARNHGLRGQESAPEVALCAGALYGTEYDSLTWGFDVEDNKELWQRGLYAHRAAMSSNQHPALFFHNFNMGKGHKKATLTTAQRLEKLGMPVFLSDGDVEWTLQMKIPDSVALSDKEVKEQYPTNLQFYRCNKAMEKNDGKKGGRGTGKGRCSAYQHDHSVCNKRADMKDWFPGWKGNAVRGYAYAMTMMAMLSDAIEEMGKEEPLDTSDLAKAKARVEKQLNELLQEEKEEYKPLRTGGTLASMPSWLEEQANLDVREHFNITALHQAPALCRIPFMPSDTRLRGIFTDKPVAYGEGYEDVMPLQKFLPTTNESSHPLPVVTNLGERGGCKEPGFHLASEKSFRDTFLAGSGANGWQTVTIPNKAEQQHYSSFDAQNSKGWIIMCVLKCSTCPVEKMILGGKVSSGTTQIEMEVNGVRVSGFTNFFTHSGECRALKHEDENPSKQFIWTPNSEGRYDIRLQIKSTSRARAKITSFILM